MAQQNHFGFEHDELRAFTEGGCWALASELHASTGWQLVAIGYADELVQPVEERSWGHVGVRRPDGLIIDITGVHDELEWMASWHNPAYGATFEIGPQQLLGFDRCWPHAPEAYAGKILSQLAEVAPLGGSALDCWNITEQSRERSEPCR